MIAYDRVVVLFLPNDWMGAFPLSGSLGVSPFTGCLHLRDFCFYMGIIELALHRIKNQGMVNRKEQKGVIERPAF